MPQYLRERIREEENIRQRIALEEETDTCEEEEDITNDPDFVPPTSLSDDTEEERGQKPRPTSYKKRKFANLSRTGKYNRVKRILCKTTDRDELHYITKNISKKNSKMTKMAALWLINTVRLSKNSYTDLRCWLKNESKAGKDLSTLPIWESLYAWAKRALLPPGITVVEGMARVPLQSLLNTTCVRYVLCMTFLHNTYLRL